MELGLVLMRLIIELGLLFIVILVIRFVYVHFDALTAVPPADDSDAYGRPPAVTDHRYHRRRASDHFQASPFPLLHALILMSSAEWAGSQAV